MDAKCKEEMAVLRKIRREAEQDGLAYWHLRKSQWEHGPEVHDISPRILFNHIKNRMRIGESSKVWSFFPEWYRIEDSSMWIRVHSYRMIKKTPTGGWFCYGEGPYTRFQPPVFRITGPNVRRQKIFPTVREAFGEYLHRKRAEKEHLLDKMYKFEKKMIEKRERLIKRLGFVQATTAICMKYAHNEEFWKRNVNSFGVDEENSLREEIGSLIEEGQRAVLDQFDPSKPIDPDAVDDLMRDWT